MKKIEYKCNLCQEIKNKVEVRCMFWKCAIVPQQWTFSTTTTEIDNSDIHICDKCITLIKES